MMKKIYVLIVIILVVIISLLIYNTYNYNRDTKEKFGKFVLKRLITDKDAISIFKHPYDSLLVCDSNSLFFYRFYNDSIRYDYYLKSRKSEINFWREKALELKFNKRNIEFSRCDIITDNNSYYPSKKFRIYFFNNNNEYFFDLLGVDSLKNKWVAIGLTPPTNQAEVDRLEMEKRKMEAKELYKPSGLYFISCNWNYKYSYPKTFTNFFVTLKNSTNNDFHRIKFRVTIYNNLGYYKTEIFSKTIEKSESIYSNDVIRFEIIELRNFYTGINIINENNFNWSAEIIDAKPRPGYEDLPY